MKGEALHKLLTEPKSGAINKEGEQNGDSIDEQDRQQYNGSENKVRGQRSVRFAVCTDKPKQDRTSRVTEERHKNTQSL